MAVLPYALLPRDARQAVDRRDAARLALRLQLLLLPVCSPSSDDRHHDDEERVATLCPRARSSERFRRAVAALHKARRISAAAPRRSGTMSLQKRILKRVKSNECFIEILI